MANTNIINPRNIVLTATLVSLIGMTPLCSGTSYDFYDAKNPAVGLTDKEFSSAIDSLVTEYRKEAPAYNIKGSPYFAKAENDNEYLLLIYPYFGGCGAACYPALMKKTTQGTLQYVKDFERLNCREFKNQDVKLKCDHSSGFF